MKQCPICGQQFENETNCPSCGMLLINISGGPKDVPESTSKTKKTPQRKSRFKTKSKTEVPFEPQDNNDMEPEISGQTDSEYSTYSESVPETSEKPFSSEPETPVTPPYTGYPSDAQMDKSEPEEDPISEDFVNADDIHIQEPEFSPDEYYDRKEEYDSQIDSAWDKQNSHDTQQEPDDSYRQKEPAKKKPVQEDYGYIPHSTYSSSDDSHKKNGGLSFNPLILVVIVVAIIFVIVAIFFMKNRSTSSSTAGEKQIAAEDNVVMDETEDDVNETAAVNNSNITSDFSWSDVDIDAIANENQYMSGYLMKDNSTSGWELYLMDPNNIAIKDENGESVMVSGVNTLKIKDDIYGVDFNDYESCYVNANGSMYLEGETIYYVMTDIQSDGVATEDTSIHQYTVFCRDCSWEEAYNIALSEGGYLARINSEEEYNEIVELLNVFGYTRSNMHFYIGGRRNEIDKNYYWVDENNEFFGDPLNGTTDWIASHWYKNEPSYSDGDIDENVLGLFYVGDTWYLNDNSDNLYYYYPDLLKDKIGFIVEFE